MPKVVDGGAISSPSTAKLPALKVELRCLLAPAAMATPLAVDTTLQRELRRRGKATLQRVEARCPL
eukprot:CAMPEP_0169067820 /NCGR_PEP_ID=MMETSP1015-20121227/3695_1 /TAXON_ID=342587 /ORGANISM="Karlodinium micrum, Strain CCMP2283" /LENGTH=65 /DNA_ID=CAMNT_0009126595 /DNA_START=305 /DNA_END=502 /DNA_ORIENTATION=-